MKNVIICDLDGTLADLRHRRHLVERPTPEQLASTHQGWKPNWPAFHSACVDDTPLSDTIAVVDALACDPRARRELWIVSGRSEAVRAQTEAWLWRQGVIHWNRLIMRPVGDYTRDDDLKERWLLGGILPRKERILCVFDDRDRVVKMWRRHGLTCHQVAPGDF
jgi:hypothetical protein